LTPPTQPIKIVTLIAEPAIPKSTKKATALLQNPYFLLAPHEQFGIFLVNLLPNHQEEKKRKKNTGTPPKKYDSI